jgi:di/tricarboxylate transporter
MKRFIFTALLIALLLIVAAPAFAQEAPPPSEVPDLTPVIDDLSGKLDAFLTSAAIVMGVLAFLVTQGFKWLLPNTTVKAETIYGGVVLVFTVIFFVATMADQGARLDNAVQIGNVLAETLKAILAMLVIPTAAYNYFEKRGNPVAGGHQSNKAFRLEAPKPRTESTTADINISAKSTHDGNVGIASAKG